MPHIEKSISTKKDELLLLEEDTDDLVQQLKLLEKKRDLVEDELDSCLK